MGGENSPISPPLDPRLLLFMIPFVDCNCPKAKPRSDGKLVVDAICDKIGECMCPTIADAGEVTLTDSGCVVGGMLLFNLRSSCFKITCLRHRILFC